MANSIYEATGDGSTTDFTIPYTYLEANDVTAFIGGVSTPFTFTSNNIVSFATAPANGASVRILRNTDVGSLNVTYSDGGALTAEQLNDSNTQLLFGVQEAIDTANEAMILDNDGKFQGQVSSINRVIKNVADPTNAQDVATKNYVDTGVTSQVTQATQQATNAAASATASANSAASSAASASASSTSEVNAAASATASSADAVSTAADAVSTSADAVSTAADRVQTGLDATASSNSATNAQAWAIQTTGIVDSTGYSAKSWSIGGTGITNTAGAGASQEWATKTTATVDGTEYSAKEYAIGSQVGNTLGSAKQWSLGGGASYDVNTTVDGSNYSAKYYAELAAASADAVDDKYLGAKSSDPALDNDGNALVTGALYYNSVNTIMRVWNGTAWEDVAASTAGFASNGFAIAMAIAL